MADELETFTSLRRRLVFPLLGAASLAAVVVAGASYWLADRSAEAESRSKFASIRTLVQETSFPLTRNVLGMLATLTAANWFTVDGDGQVVEFALDASDQGSSKPKALTNRFDLELLPRADEDTRPSQIAIGEMNFQAMRFSDLGSRRASGDLPHDIVVLVDDSQRQQSLYRAAAIPLLTGLSTILLLTSITWFLAERLINRIGRLQLEVESIARGDFLRQMEPGADDELGKLSQSVARMAEQLNQMWIALRQRHGQQLLHQISGGLAHNLRNTLTGARMAIELVQRQLPSPSSQASIDSTGLTIAVSQLEQAEAYVQRLLLVSRGQESRMQAVPIRDCLEGLRLGLESTAEHRGVNFRMTYDDGLKSQAVADGPTLLAAISNLVWNAIEAGKRVDVSVGICSPNQCSIEVSDDGPGPDQEIEGSLFEPFVSSKSEGLGLGLPLVRRAAESLRGEVQWNRRSDRTVFVFRFPMVQEEAS